jgi:hypothetical protein
MATKADFTKEEFETLQRGVTGAGLLVSLTDRDFTDSFGEARALGKYLSQQRESESTLVRDVAAIHGTKFGVGTSPDELEAGTESALRAAVATLEAKAPDDVDAYRQLVLGAAEHVADAKGGGTSDKEAAAIAKVKQALGA